MITLDEVFPPFALQISCGRVALRVLRDDDLPELVELVRGGIDHASAAVSRKAGYVDSGRRPIVQGTRNGPVAVDEHRVAVTPDTCVSQDGAVAVEGAEVLRRSLGIDR
jgi:hypothetical protein